MAKSPGLSHSFLDHIVGNATWTSPAPVFIALHTATPGTTGASEASGAGASNYVRVEAPAASWGAAVSSSMANSAAITFPEGGDAQTITHFSVWSAITAGDFLRGGALTASFAYNSNITPQFAIGACVLSES